MRTVGKHAAVGALLGLVAVTVFALGTWANDPSAPQSLIVRFVLAVSMGGLLTGAPAGAAIGGIVGAVRLRSLRDQPAPVPSPPNRPAVLAGAEQQSAPRSLRPGEQQAIRTQAAQHQEKRTDAEQPVPLAPVSKPPPRRPAPRVNTADPERINAILAELDDMPGMDAVAQQVRSMAKRVRADERRQQQGLPVAEFGLHMLFLGPPGTGKTTVARVYGRVLAAAGLLPTDRVVEVERPDLVGETIGSTGPKTLSKISEATGGVLFLDEAYTLAGGSGQDFGGEAVATLLKAMEDRRGTFALIAAGYEDKMGDFLRTNPGLRSRFARTVTFPHYRPGDLLAVARTMAAKSEFEWTAGAEDVLLKALSRLCAAPPEGWANCREVRYLLDDAINGQADRLEVQEEEGLEVTPEDVRTLTTADVTAALRQRYPSAL